LTWLDWGKGDGSLIEFTASLAKLRNQFPQLSDDRFLSGEKDSNGIADALWLGADGNSMDWSDHHARALGLILSREGERIAIWLNGGSTALEPRNPSGDGHQWLREFCSASGQGLPARSVALYVEKRVKTAGVSDELVGRLATEAGIARECWEIDGTHHRVEPDTLRHLLRALDLSCETPTLAEETLR